MEKIFIGTLLLLCSMYHAQSIKELNFNSNVPDAENNYVAVPYEKLDDGYGFGYIYFDEFSGYTYRIIGSLKEESGTLKVVENPDAKKAIQIQRIRNLDFKTAKIPTSMVKQLGYPEEPEWLKNYKSTASENDKVLNRASKMNGAGFPNLALPKLQKLYQTEYKTKKLYFELAFSYNALKDFSNAEKITNEALKTKVTDDLIFKEHVFALVNQSKISDAEKFIENHLKFFQDESYKAESIINLIAYSNHYKQKNIAEKWLNFFKNEIKSTQFNRHIEQLESLINSKE